MLSQKLGRGLPVLSMGQRGGWTVGTQNWFPLTLGECLTAVSQEWPEGRNSIRTESDPYSEV